MGGTVRIGVSGWRYPPWRGHFYPRGLPQARELEYAARNFSSIELNGSFYSLQRPSSYAQWARQTPPDFVFAIKGSRYITHMLKLRGVETALANFLASGLFELGAKLGPILWQFPATTRFHEGLFEDFFSILPRTSTQALWVAHAYDHRLKGRASLEPEGDFALRHAVEVRHPSFAVPEFIRLLRRHGIAWVVADTPKPWPLYEDITADFVYVRLHGARRLYQSRYSRQELQHWAGLIDAWRRGRQPGGPRLICQATARERASRDVYCYFDNTDKRHAPANARELIELLQQL